jgi:hypothetical protein
MLLYFMYVKKSNFAIATYGVILKLAKYFLL